jgi:hypothetical protein
MRADRTGCRLADRSVYRRAGLWVLRRGAVKAAKLVFQLADSWAL